MQASLLNFDSSLGSQEGEDGSQTCSAQPKMLSQINRLFGEVSIKAYALSYKILQ